MKRKFTKVPVTAGSKKSDPHDILMPSDNICFAYTCNRTDK